MLEETLKSVKAAEAKAEEIIKEADAKAASVLEEAKIKKSSYNTPEVNAALREMFHGKCYICESKDITSYQIEHLYSYHKELNLKYDWNNLFCPALIVIIRNLINMNQ